MDTCNTGLRSSTPKPQPSSIDIRNWLWLWHKLSHQKYHWYLCNTLRPANGTEWTGVCLIVMKMGVQLSLCLHAWWEVCMHAFMGGHGQVEGVEWKQKNWLCKHVTWPSTSYALTHANVLGLCLFNSIYILNEWQKLIERKKRKFLSIFWESGHHHQTLMMSTMQWCQCLSGWHNRDGTCCTKQGPVPVV